MLANLAGFDGSPESMRRLQLEYGAEIGRAIVNFDGPIAFCVISRFHGGAFVVFSQRLNDQLETSALEGAHASVIGGAPAAAVVFAREVDSRTREDARIAALDERIAAAEGSERERLRAERDAEWTAVRAEKLGELASEFDGIHSVQRAVEVGSVDRIVSAAGLRPYLIDAVERGVARTLEREHVTVYAEPGARASGRRPNVAAPMLHVHRAERADGLVDALAALLAQPLEDPFAPEVIAVPTRGMERWLTQRLSTGLGVTPGRADGVCANVDFPSPRRLADEAVAVASGIEPDADAWLPERLVWALLEVVDGALQEPWLQSLAAHLGATLDTADPSRQARRFASVRHIAELFDRYALQRPSMIRAWAAGKDVDATGARLPQDARWQAELWRRLRARAGQPDPAERIESACARLREEPGLVELPDRLSVFGLTRLPAGRLQVLQALGRPARRAPVPAAPVAGAVGAGRAGPAGHPPRRGRHARAARQPAARVLGAGRARAAARHRPARRGRPPPSRRRRPPARCSPPSRPACARTSRRPGRRSRTAPTSGSSSARTAASRSTPATAAPARSRCCATRSCTSSPRTRRSSRAT